MSQADTLFRMFGGTRTPGANDNPEMAELTRRYGSKLAPGIYKSSPGYQASTDRFLPPELRGQGANLGAGLQGIGELIRNPAGLGSNINQAIAPRLNAEMSSIGQNYRNLASEQAGAAARGNVPVSIKGALQKALATNQGRAEQEARANAITESEDLRRGDVGQTYQLLDTILQFLSSGRGIAIPGATAANAMRSQASQQSNAANTAMIGSLLQAFGGGG